MKLYPRVFKSKIDENRTIVVLVYKDHSETYVRDTVFKGEKDCPYNPEDEISMCVDNGCKEVHDTIIEQKEDFIDYLSLRIYKLREELKQYESMTSVYSRDINPDINNDGFFGEGYEKLLREAENNDTEVVVGKFLKKPILE